MGFSRKKIVAPPPPFEDFDGKKRGFSGVRIHCKKIKRGGGHDKIDRKTRGSKKLIFLTWGAAFSSFLEIRSCTRYELLELFCSNKSLH